MAGNIKTTRLGDILLEKGLLSAEQLRLAVEEQRRRRQSILVTDKQAMDATSIGEILIDMGFITRQQLKRGLNWQMYLRKMTLVMSFCAPLMTIASGGATAQTTTTSSSGTRTDPISLVIQAEDYSAMKGVITATSTDVGGGKIIGSFDAGDWMSYGNMAIDIPKTGSYKVTYRVTSPLGDGSFELHEADGSARYGVVTVPKTGDSKTWVDVERTVTLTEGTHTFGLTAVTKGCNINWFKIESISGVASSASSSSAPSTTSSVATSSVPPIAGAPADIAPILVEAESYSSMLGVKTQATTDAGGGLNVSYIEGGDWMSYDNIPITTPTLGVYKITYRVSSLAGGGSFSLRESDGSVDYDVINVPKTGGWQKWIDVERTVVLPAGAHKLGVKALTTGFNFNWFKIEYLGEALPLTIQAESYVAMSGVKTQTTSDVGAGLNVSYIEAGDWMSYENRVVGIPATGQYKVTYRVSSLSGGGSLSFHEADGSLEYDKVTIPSTGNWQKWVDVERTVTLAQGSHMFGITALSNGFNLNWFKIEPIAGSGGAASSAATSSAPGSAISSAASSTSKVSSSAASSAPQVSSSASSVSSAAASSTSSLSHDVAGPVYLQWNIPRQREDGTTLDTTELGGYEVRYRRLTDEEYTYVNIEDAWKNTHNIAWLEGSYVFEVAAFDKNGLYSKFMAISPH